MSLKYAGLGGSGQMCGSGHTHACLQLLLRGPQLSFQALMWNCMRKYMYHLLPLTYFCENFQVEFSSPAFKVYGNGLTGVLADPYCGLEYSASIQTTRPSSGTCFICSGF